MYVVTNIPHPIIIPLPKPTEAEGKGTWSKNNN